MQGPHQKWEHKQQGESGTHCLGWDLIRCPGRSTERSLHTSQQCSASSCGCNLGRRRSKKHSSYFQLWKMAQNLSLGGQPSASPPWGGSYPGWELQCCTSTEGKQHLHLSKWGHCQRTLLAVPNKIGFLHFSPTSPSDPCKAPYPPGCKELLTERLCADHQDTLQDTKQLTPGWSECFQPSRACR